MRFMPRCTVLILVLLNTNAWAQSPEPKLTVTGKLVRVMAIGGESTGWAIEMDPAITLGDKQIGALQVRYRSTSKLEKLENKRVKATGKITRQRGVETGAQPVLDISSIKEAASTPGTQPKTQ